MKRKSPRSPFSLPRGQQSKYANPLWYKRILNSVHYVNLKQAKEKLETKLLLLVFFSKMSTFVTETSLQFKE